LNNRSVKLPKYKKKISEYNVKVNQIDKIRNCFVSKVNSLRVLSTSKPDISNIEVVKTFKQAVLTRNRKRRLIE